MPSSKSKSATKRVKVENLPSKGKKLTSKDAKKVKGGALIEPKPKEKW
jgi:hypothetical protein